MSNESKREYLAAIIGRYHRVGRKYKKSILNEFCSICGYHRKHAIRLLRRIKAQRRKRCGAVRQYGPEVMTVLKEIWLVSDRLCSKLLKAALPVWLPFYRKKHELSKSLYDQLLRISPATMDRLLMPVRRQYGSRGRCGTRPGTLLKHLVPIKTDQADVDKPGFLEADTVAHCGNSLDGSFVWSLTMTDIFSGWTENRAVWNKGYTGVKQAIAEIENGLPFKLLGFQTDNGGEFLNYHLVRYFSERELPVHFTRGRPYHKNDTAHVEQKNWTSVRLLLGYQRIENEKVIPVINELYRVWAWYHNFYCPSLKLLCKSKVGSRYIKKYAPPQTPYQRLMKSPEVDEMMKTHLTDLYCNLNPFSLKKQIDYKQRLILKELR